jgi:hypothetical protein
MRCPPFRGRPNVVPADPGSWLQLRIAVLVSSVPLSLTHSSGRALTPRNQQRQSACHPCTR